jgi:mono/diheme cytochrome c family protein
MRRGWWILPATVALAAAGCRRDMQDMPRYKPLAESRFFTDDRSARPIPAGTIARDELNDTDGFHTGEVNGAFLSQIPMKIDKNMLERGQERFNIYCTPCHGMLGDGQGMVARRGFKWPADLNSDRIRKAPPGYLFQVISNGYGAMPDYADQISVPDRWEIVAYIRALELSRSATLNDVPTHATVELEHQP